MPPTFGASIEQVQEFVALAAYSNKFRRSLKDNPREVLLEFGVDIPAEEIPDNRTLPSKAHCARMLALIQDYDSFADGEYDSGAVACIVMFFAYAMPLVPTVEGEVGAAR